ncbi:C560-like protein [Mya arenaria]|uniref:C560-like protein n=1 Tax=Mya arenaria TaxID=6604 RepID=A0ABY7EAF1_MYAAR|nr:C560-like protein [Mya arenaria]
MAAAALNNNVFMVKSAGPMSTIQAYQQMEDFWKKNRQLNRPLSPHLSIYKPQLTSMLSLCHRVTAVSAGSIFMFLAPHNFEHYLNVIQGLEMAPAIIIALKYVLAFPVSYHYVNGIRHLAWDWSWGFGLERLYKTGYFALTLALIVASTLVFGL